MFFFAFVLSSSPSPSLDDYAFNLKKSLETPFIQSHFFDDLQIASITRGVKVSSAGALNLTSKAGDVSVFSLQDLTLKSAAGKVSIQLYVVYVQKVHRVTWIRLQHFGDTPIACEATYSLHILWYISFWLTYDTSRSFTPDQTVIHFTSKSPRHLSHCIKGFSMWCLSHSRFRSSASPGLFLLLSLCNLLSSRRVPLFVLNTYRTRAVKCSTLHSNTCFILV